MKLLGKRILVNGLLTAAMLAVVGVGFAELAGFWLMSSAPRRATLDAPVAAAPQDPVAESLKTRVPLMMALWGFGFVAVGEVVLHRIRRKKAVAISTAPPSPSLPVAENSPVLQ
jgi:hypothetical protein